MTNFDLLVLQAVHFKYADNCTSSTVQWNNVPLNNQVTLQIKGKYITYKQVLIIVATINEQHPVSAVFSDTFTMESIICFMQ